ncbi:MAG: hypothetical protein RBS07_12485 [Lentimicrobium sp.]|jgi:hypothetical protein|nr:hypothetical protein [Lentimicrobium sp.]
MGIVSSLLRNIDGVYWFPLIALVLFVVFFLAIAVHTWTMKSDQVEQLARFPLDEDDNKNDLNF